MTGKLTSVGSDALNWIARSVSSALDSKNLRVEVRPIGTPRRVGVTCSAMATPTVTVSDAISAPAPLRADATIVSDGVVAALGTVKVAVNGAVVSAGSATPLTVNRTLATPRPVLARASIGSWLFSVTDRPLTGFVILKLPVRNVKVSGVLSGLPSAAVSGLPNGLRDRRREFRRDDGLGRPRIGRREADDGVRAAERDCAGDRRAAGRDAERRSGDGRWIDWLVERHHHRRRQVDADRVVCRIIVRTRGPAVSGDAVVKVNVRGAAS